MTEYTSGINFSLGGRWAAPDGGAVNQLELQPRKGGRNSPLTCLFPDVSGWFDDDRFLVYANWHALYFRYRTGGAACIPGSGHDRLPTGQIFRLQFYRLAASDAFEQAQSDVGNLNRGLERAGVFAITANMRGEPVQV